MRSIIRKNLIWVLIFTFMILMSCSHSDLNIENVDESSVYVPEPVNLYAIEKETEVETVEPTEAHRPYPTDFSMPAEKEVVIGEKQFLTKVNYIYNHIDKFAASHVIVEGMYGMYTSWDETFKFPMVYRNGPGNYGDDQYGGFYLVNVPMEALKIDDWVKVRGIPFMYDHTDSENEVHHYLFLLAESVEVLDTKNRKAEMVND